MARVSIYVSDDLKSRMAEVGDALNWSDIARPAFEAAIATFNHQRGRNMETVIERLRASKAQYTHHAEGHGKAAGRQWGSDKASFFELRAISELDLGVLTDNLERIEGAIVRALDPENTYGSDAAEIIFGDRAWPTKEWLLGWIEGAQELFEEVKDQL